MGSYILFSHLLQWFYFFHLRKTPGGKFGTGRSYYIAYNETKLKGDV